MLFNNLLAITYESSMLYDHSNAPALLCFHFSQKILKIIYYAHLLNKFMTKTFICNKFTKIYKNLHLYVINLYVIN